MHCRAPSSLPSCARRRVSLRRAARGGRPAAVAQRAPGRSAHPASLESLPTRAPWSPFCAWALAAHTRGCAARRRAAAVALGLQAFGASALAPTERHAAAVVCARPFWGAAALARRAVQPDALPDAAPTARRRKHNANLTLTRRSVRCGSSCLRRAAPRTTPHLLLHRGRHLTAPRSPPGWPCRTRSPPAGRGRTTPWALPRWAARTT
jgi:hypothetical protein